MKYILIVKMFDKNTNAKVNESRKKLDSMAEALRKIKKFDELVIHENYTCNYEIAEVL